MIHANREILRFRPRLGGTEYLHFLWLNNPLYPGALDRELVREAKKSNLYINLFR
jgi:hypothetical protein